MKNREQQIEDSGIEQPAQETSIDEKKIEQEKRVLAISRYIEREIIGMDSGLKSKKDKEEIEHGLEDMSVQEKAIRIYEDLISASLKKRGEKGKKILNPYLVSEMKELWKDEEAKQTFLQTYANVRIEAKKFRLADMVNVWRDVEDDIVKLKNRRAKLEQNLRLRIAVESDDVRATKSELGNVEKALKRAQVKREAIINLEKYEHIQENTDVSALIMYETIRKYHEEGKIIEGKGGFVWLPSRERLREKIKETMEETGKSPLPIGPPGTGKTTLINAVAEELTGEPAVRIPCGSGLGEEGIIANRDIKKGEGSYDYRGTVAEAATGFMHSTDIKQTYEHGRFAFLDEISQLNLDRALGPVKDVRQAEEGRPLSRYVPHKVLPGFSLAATSNMPIADERLDREFERVPTNYFEMSTENPELYEFMLSKLLQDEGHFPVMNTRDLAPAYEKKEIPEDKRKTLKDGSIVIETDELIKDQTDKKHGFLYRFAYAVRALQDSYIHGSKFNEKHLANIAFYEDRDNKGNIIIKKYIPDLKINSEGGGELLKLKSGSSTLTAKIISKWMDRFAVSGERCLPKWIQHMMENHIDQTSYEDGERIRAIFNHFHLFDEVETVRGEKPLTPKEIGYLSPRVPRPVYVERPQKEETEIAVEKSPKEIKKYETKQVLLEDGSRILIKTGDFSLGKGKAAVSILPGRKFRIKGEDFSLAGVVEDEKNEHNGKPVGQLASEENLYRIFDARELDLGVLSYESEELIAEIVNMKEDVDDFCRSV